MHSYVLSRIPQFLAVAKTGSFTAGALRLNVNQPSVTKSIRQLEEFLQVELFTRNRSGVQLTAEGHIFFNNAKQVEILTQEIIDKVNANSVGKKTILSIGAGPVFSSVYLPRILSRFVKEFPEIEINVLSGNSKEMYPKLVQGELSCYLGAHPDKSTDKLGKQFSIKPLGRQRYCLVQSSAVGARALRQVMPNAELKTLVTLWTSESRLTQLKILLEQQDFAFANLLRVNTIQLIKELVTHADCVGIIPQALLSEFDPQQIDSRLILGANTGYKVGCSYRKSLGNTKYFSRFLSLLEDAGVKT